MPDKDYYSFDEVLADLRMEEDDLKRLVSAGEIRAFRDQDTMRFKAADVERLKAAAPASAPPADLELEFDDDLDLAPGRQATDVGPAEDLILEDDGEQSVEGGEIDLGAAADERRPGAAQRAGRTQAAVVPEATDPAGIMLVLVSSFVLLVFANFAVLGAASGRANALTGFLADWFST